jgi:hypothetical protein
VRDVNKWFAQQTAERLPTLELPGSGSDEQSGDDRSNPKTSKHCDDPSIGDLNGKREGNTV